MPLLDRYLFAYALPEHQRQVDSRCCHLKCSFDLGRCTGQQRRHRLPFWAGLDIAGRDNDLHLVGAGGKLIKVIETGAIGDSAGKLRVLCCIQNYRRIDNERFVSVQLRIAVLILIDPPLNGDRLGKTSIPNRLALLHSEGEDGGLPTAGQPQSASITIDGVVKPLVALGGRQIRAAGEAEIVLAGLSGREEIAPIKIGCSRGDRRISQHGT